jgi:FlaA1/EpsC-like NDP-sugar epimerase
MDMKYRLAIVLPIYLVLFSCSYFGAYLLRFDFDLPDKMLTLFWASLPLVIATKFLSCYISGEWRRTFRYVSFLDLIYLVSGSALAMGLIYFSNFFTTFAGGAIPRAVILIDFGLSIIAVGALRMSIRFYKEFFCSLLQKGNQKRTLIYGANLDSLAIMKAMESLSSEFHVIGFVCDQIPRHERLIAGKPIFRTDKGWKTLAAVNDVQHLLIPSTIAGKEVRELYRNCSCTDIKTHIIPSVTELMGGRFRLAIRDVTISDLLRREPAKLDFDAIRGDISGRTILVTGAAGSIGSELCRQIIQLNPSKLILLDQSETGLFYIQQELIQANWESDSEYIIADVVNEDAIRKVMVDHEPQLIFHAAAYKHVPLMEDHPQEAIRNNILGTKNLADLASEYNVESFVLISTDKAVRPTSVMGSTKLISEIYLQAKSTISKTRFVTVRFGNVLNSAGSVVPTFRKQIEQGGPVRVTHPDMERFFMTIPEAVKLVLQAETIGASGDILILDMGEQIKIVDLAKDMITLSGMNYPEDIDIEFTGIRPGEKLYEELLYDSEKNATKVHDKLFCATRQDLITMEMVTENFQVLEECVNGEKEKVRKTLADIVKQYVELELSATEKMNSAA